MRKNFISMLLVVFMIVLMSTCKTVADKANEVEKDQSRVYTSLIVGGFDFNDKNEFTETVAQLTSVDVAFVTEEAAGLYKIILLNDDRLIEKLKRLEDSSAQAQAFGKKTWTCYWPYVATMMCYTVKAYTRAGAYLKGKPVSMACLSPVCYVREGNWHNDTNFCGCGING